MRLTARQLNRATLGRQSAAPPRAARRRRGHAPRRCAPGPGGCVAVRRAVESAGRLRPCGPRQGIRRPHDRQGPADARHPPRRGRHRLPGLARGDAEDAPGGSPQRPPLHPGGPLGADADALMPGAPRVRRPTPRKNAEARGMARPAARRRTEAARVVGVPPVRPPVSHTRPVGRGRSALGPRMSRRRMPASGNADGADPAAGPSLPRGVRPGDGGRTSPSSR